MVDLSGATSPQIIITTQEDEAITVKMTVQIYYFPIRGRAEVIKLLCAAKGVQFEMKDVDYEQMKTDRAQYPFGQCPRLVDGDVDICQSNAMVR